MPSRKSDVRQSDVSAIVSRTEDSPMTIPPAVAGAAPTTEREASSAGPHATASFAPLLATPTPSETPGVIVADTAARAGATEKAPSGKEKEREAAVTIEDLNLPKSIITRLAKGVLPPNTQIQANAILALSKSATVFISHLSNAANEWTVSAGKKTIMPADVFRALDDIEYGFMRERLEAEFAKFNDVQSTKRSAYRRKVSAAKRAARGDGAGENSMADSSMLSAGTGAAGDESHFADTTVATEDGGGEGGSSSSSRAAKKARVEGAGDGGKMDVDGEGRQEGDGEGEVSDAESVPDEHVEEDEDEDDEEEEEEEEEEEDEEEEGGDDGDEDGLEDRGGREEQDEALDEDSE